MFEDFFQNLDWYIWGETWYDHKSGTPTDIEYKRISKKFVGLTPTKAWELAVKNIKSKAEALKKNKTKKNVQQIKLKPDPYFNEVARLRKKFPKLSAKTIYQLANKNLYPDKLDLTKNPIAKPTGKLIPKGKMQSERLETKSQPEKEVVIVKEENKGINIYLIIVAAAAAYYFLYKKKR
jgi:hypothetical protein